MTETPRLPPEQGQGPTASPPAGEGTPSASGLPTLPPSGHTGEWASQPLRVGSPPGYEMISELGRGGMGVVYKAKQIKLNRLTALKVILAAGHAGEADLARFRTEAEAIARLQHPNIVQIFEVGEQDGLPFFSLEFCPGGSLERKLNGTPIPPGEAAALVRTLARAMHAAHLKGIVHRDLKPANVLLAEDGTPKIADFGLAKMLDGVGRTASGAVMGTPGYMAPEQAGGKSGSVAPATDVYALGAILYECLTARPPFRAATALDTILQVVADAPVPPSHLRPHVPRDLESICLKCLEKEPRNRYSTAEELADDLRRFLDGEATWARPVGWGTKVARWFGSQVRVAMRWTLAGLVAGLCIGLTSAAPFALRGNLSDLAFYALLAWVLLCISAGTVTGARFGVKRQSRWR